MELPIDILVYAKGSGIVTLLCLGLAALGFVFKWGIRFRLVGVTGFLLVLTSGLFALNLALFTRTVVPGAVRYTLVYDNGANQTAIAVSPTITEAEAIATLRQASDDLYSPGRLGLGKNRLTIRLRTVIHPEAGVSVPLYLGEVQRSLTQREDNELKLQVFPENLAQLPTPTDLEE